MRMRPTETTPTRSSHDRTTPNPQPSTLNPQRSSPCSASSGSAEGQTEFRSLADYIAPAESGRKDYLGAFAVTAGLGCDELAAQFDAEHDEYNSIMVKALADRLAEAFAEFLHKLVRTEVWQYESGDALTNEQLIAEEYRGIRPAFGYPRLPRSRSQIPPVGVARRRAEDRDQTDRELCHTCGPRHPLVVSTSRTRTPRYFAVDRITRDQVESYAERIGLRVTDVERWLAPNLGYES